VVNKHSLKKYLTGFFILNKNLLSKNKKLITIELKVINIKIVQKKESLAFVLQMHL